MMKKKILAGLAALAVVAGFSAFAATPAASETPSSAPYEQGYTCYDNGYCPGPQRHGCYDGQNNCYTDIRTMAIARVRAAAAGPIPAAVVRAGRIARPMVTSGKQFI